MSAELELDTLQDIYLHLDEGARLITEGVTPETLGKLFAKVESTRASRRGPVRCVCTKKGALKRVRTFAAEFEASVPGGEKLKFVSLPGCFCHRRPDEGGLALAEVLWSYPDPQKRDFADFKRRAAIHRDAMVARGINAAPIK